MKIAINAIRVSQKGGGGLDHYTISLINHLAQTGLIFDLYTLSPRHFKSVDPKRIFNPITLRLYRPESISDPKTGGIAASGSFRSKIARRFGDISKLFWTQCFFSWVIFFKQYDIIFSPTQLEAMPFTFGVKQVVTVHDLTPFILKDQKHKHPIFLRFLMPLALRKAARLIAVSQNTKKDLVEILSLEPEKIEAIYEAPGEYPVSEPLEAKVGELKRKFKLENYFLCVSGGLPHKNLKRLLEACALIRDWKNFKLLLVGYLEGKERDALAKLLSEKGINDKITFAGHVRSEEMPALYAGSAFFIFPSIYEGFGLPPLEALAYGKAVILSRSASLPEVGGDAALYFDPLNVEELAAKILLLLENPDLRNTLARKALDQAKKFSWGKAAEETKALFENILKS